MTWFSGSPSFAKLGEKRNTRRAFATEAVIERLGDRVLPATYIVQTTSDVVGGTVEIKYVGNDTYEVPMLRTAIEQANLNSGTDTIQFVDAILAQPVTLSAYGGGGGFWGTDGNGGSGFRGAIFALNSSTNIQSSTIADNGASSGGNQVYVLVLGPQATSTAYLANSIVGRTDTSGQPDFIHRAIRGGRLPHLGGVANFVSVPGRFPKRAISATGDPMLGPLADNGGTTMTLKPLAGSPVIDAGSTRVRPRFGGLPATDQTGSPRNQGSAPDIGSVETPGIMSASVRRLRRRRNA